MVKRSELFSISRPHLKAGWTPALIKAVDDWLTGAGIPADGAAAPAIIAHTPSAPLLAPTTQKSLAKDTPDNDLLGLAVPAQEPAALAPWGPETQPAANIGRAHH